jgi:hypothetical protein
VGSHARLLIGRLVTKKFVPSEERNRRHGNFQRHVHFVGWVDSGAIHFCQLCSQIKFFSASFRINCESVEVAQLI